MHSLNHEVLGRVLADEREEVLRRRAQAGPPHHHPPPFRSRAAFAAARLARRLDPSAARRAVV